MMKEFRTIELKQGIFENNNKDARNLRERLRAQKVFLLNLMSSPGAGKTTLLTKTIRALQGELNIAVMEADIDSDVDARTIADTGVEVVQLHTGGMCHLDAEMTRQGIDSLGTEDLDIVVLENVGNLVCPAEFDTGAAKNAMILSIPEGDDKPLKYPLMFGISDVLIINKTDTLHVFDFDLVVCTERVKNINPKIEIIALSAKTGEGMEKWADWLRRETAAVKGGT
jgi:hydrogenase nickel incorporation protein HypB